MDYKKFNSSFFLVILILFGSFLRIYNINYDDLWSDEMISFWNSDPTIGFRETIDRIFSSQLMVSYENGRVYFVTSSLHLDCSSLS